MSFLLSLGIIFLSPSILAAGNISFGQFQRINQPANQSADDGFIQIDVNEKRESGPWDLVYDGSIRQYTGDRGAMFSVPELFVQRRIGRSDFILGRKIKNWQENDRFWAMGEVNPLRNFNLLETKREGLFGFHFERKTKNWEACLIASPINVPQINPTFVRNDDRITGKNEWSNPPPQAVRFRGNDVPVSYSLIYPEVKEIALQESISGCLKVKSENHSLGVYGGFKPEPGIRINATGYYEQINGERAVVTAKPFVNHHYFWGGSYSTKWYKDSSRSLTSHVSIEGVIPERGDDKEFFELAALKIQPVYERVTYGTASLKWKSPLIKTSLNSLYLIDGDTENLNVFARKPRWRRAVGVDLELSLSDRLKWFSDYKYDLKTRDMVFLTRADYQVFKHISIGGGLQILNSPDDASFWAPFRSNDSFIGRFSYLF